MKTVPAELWHGSKYPDLTLSKVRPGLHVGSRRQAEARWPGQHLYRISLKQVTRITRMRDEGYWNRRRLQAATKRAPLAIYLNRFEGLPESSLVDAALHHNDSDTSFRRKVAGCEDSFIVLDPCIIERLERIELFESLQIEIA